MSTYKLPFIPGAMNFDHMTTSLNATHPAGDAAFWTEYNLHSLNGLAQSKKTAEYLKMKKPDNRTFVSSASTFAGSGKYAQHSINSLDNSWDALNYSIAGVMNFNMFGVPLVGADACFGTSELCQRWVQLATFFPFARLNVENITTPQLNALRLRTPCGIDSNMLDTCTPALLMPPWEVKLALIHFSCTTQMTKTYSSKPRTLSSLVMPSRFLQSLKKEPQSSCPTSQLVHGFP